MSLVTRQEFKRVRTALGLTQAGLADLLKITRRSVVRMEGGQQRIMHVTALAMKYLSLTQKTKKEKPRRV